MKFKSALWVLLISVSCIAAQSSRESMIDGPEWKESEVPPPPAFDVSKLVNVDGVVNSPLVFGVDPSTIRITGSDSVVRYVMVATSSSGARNVMYEGIRCSTGEVKTYARYSPEGKWNTAANPEWRPYASLPSRHALRFAKAGACDGSAPATSVGSIVNRLKNPNSGH